MLTNWLNVVFTGEKRNSTETNGHKRASQRQEAHSFANSRTKLLITAINIS